MGVFHRVGVFPWSTLLTINMMSLAPLTFAHLR